MLINLNQAGFGMRATKWNPHASAVLVLIGRTAASEGWVHRVDADAALFLAVAAATDSAVGVLLL